MFDIIFLIKIYYLRFLFRNHKNIVIFDIDNTISNTWPNLGSNSYRESYSIAEPFMNVVRLIENLQKNKIPILYLSARSYHYYSLTKKWLKKCKIYNGNLILVNKPVDKIAYISYFNDKKVILFDDLSYNHENFQVKFHTDVLEYIKREKFIIHIDYIQLLFLQNTISIDLDLFFEEILKSTS
jgi:hypothetical protein